MRDFFALLGVIAICVFLFRSCSDDGPPPVPLTAAQQLVADRATDVREFEEQYDKEMKRFKSLKQRIPPKATDIVYIGKHWVTYYYEDVCFMLMGQYYNGGFAYSVTDAPNSVCQASVPLPSELPPTVAPNKEVQY